MNKYNYILVFKDNKVPELPSSTRNILIHESEQGWKCAKGCWKEEQIKEFEYYPLSEDWQTKSGWRDSPLWQLEF